MLGRDHGINEVRCEAFIFGGMMEHEYSCRSWCENFEGEKIVSEYLAFSCRLLCKGLKFEPIMLRVNIPLEKNVAQQVVI